MARPPPELPADLVERIFLRLPPDDPGRLFRASRVSKFWLRRLAGPDFLREYCKLHGTPPMLGFLTRHSPKEDDHVSTLFVPTLKLRPPGPAPARGYLRPLDARHGRVLFATDPPGCLYEGYYPEPEYIVWDPITHEEWVFVKPGQLWGGWPAVLCAKPGCDHLDCHGHPFQVAYVIVEEFWCSAALYSSEVGYWWPSTNFVHSDQKLAHCITTCVMTPSVLVGNTLYFDFLKTTTIIRYDLADLELSLIKKPDDCKDGKLVVENGVLGMAAIVESSICLWSREVDEHGAAAWVQPRVINLEPLLPPRSLSTKPVMCGFAERVGVVFLRTEAGIFTVDLKSGRARNLCNEGNIGDPLVPSFFQERDVPQPITVIPYMSFYTPGRDMKPLPPGQRLKKIDVLRPLRRSFRVWQKSR